MNISFKVLHLSLLLAMTLPVMAADDLTGTRSDDTQTGNEVQLAAGKGGGSGQQFMNTGEADKLRHRVNEADKEQAERKRLEKHEQDADQLKEQDRLREQDQLREGDQSRKNGNTGERQMSQVRNQYENRVSGQGFNISGSMFQNRHSHSAMSGVGSLSHASGGGGGAGRR